MILKNNANKDFFNKICNIITQKYPNTFNVNDIKSIFIKKLNNADLIQQKKVGSSGNTSHIACTTASINYFYSIYGDVAFNQIRNSENTFDINVEMRHVKKESENKFEKSKCAIWRIDKQGQASQLGLSKQNSDGELFYKLRQNIDLGDLIIFFKYIKDDIRLEDYIILLKRTDPEDLIIINDLLNNADIKVFVKYYNDVEESLTIEIPNNDDIIGINKIYYGAPGTGKSHHVNEKYFNKYSKRVLFHLDYSYHDFIGYIKPIILNESNDDEDNTLSYEFIPGPFTEILINALNDPTNVYNLIIEELNRANAPAVFGDIFQLLDRKADGNSEYIINNKEVYNHIKKILKENYKLEDGSIYLPYNLNIIATMNSADQNVFIMDTAFKRRWEFEYIPVEFDEDHKFKDKVVPKFNISWEGFVDVINTFMMSQENDDLMISEDKQIGQYFIKESDLQSISKFGYKVLLYLWDDVFKIDSYRLFNHKLRTFKDVIDAINNPNTDVFVENMNILIKEKSIQINSNRIE